MPGFLLPVKPMVPMVPMRCNVQMLENSPNPAAGPGSPRPTLTSRHPARWS